MDNQYLKQLLRCLMKIMAENKEHLIDLDSVVGDGDLGLTMSDGFAAAYKAAESFDGDDAGKLLYGSGKAMSIAVPSTMGTLMASGFMNAGKVLKGKTELSNLDIAELFQSYMDGVSGRGKAKIGDKTFLDGIYPAVEALKASLQQGESLLAGAKKAADAAEEGFKNTATMIAVHGRAATRGEASRALLDPGAAVAMLMMKAFEKSVEV
ncbi:MAG: Phosphoenolpyruvate-dihydroxyacetone phosphotransferase, ADP-binding subunit DhaL [Caproiciproducens sp.]|nr:Phosphoenolpyruvate-dihydroxyacetone phosphotransferase, ADP-binding subunit DhaL [Caproiciproducens sp.]